MSTHNLLPRDVGHVTEDQWGLLTLLSVFRGSLKVAVCQARSVDDVKDSTAPDSGEL